MTTTEHVYAPDNKEAIIAVIRDFVGKDGNIPFEHGFTVKFCGDQISEVSYDNAIITCNGSWSPRPLETLSEALLGFILVQLQAYLIYCKHYA